MWALEGIRSFFKRVKVKYEAFYSLFIIIFFLYQSSIKTNIVITELSKLYPNITLLKQDAHYHRFPYLFYIHTTTYICSEVSEFV